jgi:BsuBI/PstI restriction endonuclease domain/BsuBI/PstI restriction endonuclease HTH domain
VKRTKIEAATQILRNLGFPRAQLNDRSAVTLLALLDLKAEDQWISARNPMIGITPIMNWIREFYDVDYAPNTRETIRRQTLHQFMQAGLVYYNPDMPERPVNSPKAVYQLTKEALLLCRLHGTRRWKAALNKHLSGRDTLLAQYAKARQMELVPLTVSEGVVISMSPGAHSRLIKAIIEEFAPRFTPGSHLIYAGDTGEKMGHFDRSYLAALGVEIDSHGKMPDVVLHFPQKKWLVLVESVTSHGPVNAKRHKELMTLFKNANIGIVFVTAFQSRSIMARHIPEIAWETEVWVAEAPSHLIHFNGTRFLGPY